MPNQSTIRYLAYVRKSTEGDEKQALSIDSQKDKLRECFPNIDLIEVVEERKSAFTPDNRPAFAEVLERIRKGEAQGLVAWHPDRLSRNELDAATLTYMVRTGILRDLKFGSYAFDNSPEGIMMLQMALSHSQYFSAKLSKDVRRGMEQKAKMGWLPNAVPPGYRNTPHRSKGFKIVEKDPERFDLVRRMWDLMLTGKYTPAAIAKTASREWNYRSLTTRKGGGKSMSRSGIYRLFINPFYYGEFEYPVGSGNWHQGKHEPMISREEFERVQTLLGRDVPKPALDRKTFAFTGLIRCGECGCQITADEKRQIICGKCKHKFSYITKKACPRCRTPIAAMPNPVLLRYVYYRCTKRREDVACSQGGIEVTKLQEQIDDRLSRVQISQKYLDWAIKHLRQVHRTESRDRHATLKSQQKAYREVCRRLDGLMEMRMREEITEDEFREKKTRLTDEKARYAELLNDTDHRQKRWLDLTERTFRFARYARFWFAEGDDAHKREILTTLGSNLVLMDKKLSIDAAKPFSILERRPDPATTEMRTFEPVQNGSVKRNSEASDAPNPGWLSEWDTIRTLVHNALF
ncbi:MAG: recombinase family protein, partial [Candidatus Poribacteria bacterium]|nr:recombinase family protein [Candidatus Poribacteria bacterium]